MTEQLTGLRQLRLKNPNHCKSPFFWDRSCANSAAINKGEGGKKRKNHGKRAVYTWQNCQPCSVKGYPNRITRQACILPSILKSYIPYIENLNFFVRGVNTGSLKKNKREAREKARHWENFLWIGRWSHGALHLVKAEVERCKAPSPSTIPRPKGVYQQVPAHLRK